MSKILILSVILLTSCTQLEHTHYYYSKDSSGQIIVPVTIDGVVFKFALDTGSARSFLCKNALLKNNKFNSNYLQGNKKMEIRFYDKLDTLCLEDYKCAINIGDYKLDVNLFLFNPDSSIGMTLPEVDGVIGFDIFKKLNWLFHLKDSVFCVNREAINTELLDTINLSFPVTSKIWDNMKISALLEDSIRTEFIFDTGMCKLGFTHSGTTTYCDFILSDSLLELMEPSSNSFIPQAAIRYNLKVNNMNVKNVAFMVDERSISGNNYISCSFIYRFNYMIYDKQKNCISLIGVE
ncbi:hypothetical protein D0T85_14270 [Bacteroides sp. 519]|nr:hypothetical protein [Bacteroides sp. 519]